MHDQCGAHVLFWCHPFPKLFAWYDNANGEARLNLRRQQSLFPRCNSSLDQDPLKGVIGIPGLYPS